MSDWWYDIDRLDEWDTGMERGGFTRGFYFRGLDDKRATLSENPVFFDSAWSSQAPLSTDAPPTSVQDPFSNFGNISASHMARFTIDRHNRQINLVMADGSAGPTRLEDLWMLKWHTQWTPRKNVVVPE